MKKYLNALMVLWVLVGWCSFTATAENPKGDINSDGKVDAIDIQLTINSALGLPIPYNADIDRSGRVDAIDIQTVINCALGIFEEAATVLKQPLHQYTFPIDSGDMRYYNTMQGDCGKISGGPSASGQQENGALHIVTNTIGGATSYFGFWHSVNETAQSRHLKLDPAAALPWPISTERQFALASWYMIVKGHGNMKIELKTGPSNNETLVKVWYINNFNSTGYSEIGGDIPANTEPFKLLNIIAETNSDLYIDEIGFYVKTPKMSDLRYAFLTSLAQVLRCCGIDNASGFNLVRDRSNWPIGDFDSVPGLGFSALVAACGYDLKMVGLEDAQNLVRSCITSLLMIPAHQSGFLPHWTKTISGSVQRHPDSEISTVDTALAYISSYLACAMLGLDQQRVQLLTEIHQLDFSAVVTEQNEISHGFDTTGNRITNTWTDWGGETELVLLLAKMNDVTKKYAHKHLPPNRPNSPVAGGTGFIMEIMSLFSADFGGQNIGPDGSGINWYQERQTVLADQLAALAMPNFIGGQAAVEIVSADGFTRYHVGGTDPLSTGQTGYDSPWVAPHYMAMASSLDVVSTISRVKSLRSQGLMYPLIGPAEAVLLDPSDWSVKRWHSMQGVLNSFFSTLGYYHAVAIAEGLDDKVYLTASADAELKTATDSLFSGGQSTILSDEFTGSIVNAGQWHIPTWVSPTDGTYFGQTQVRCSQNSPLPSTLNSNAIIALNTYNPTGSSFYGTDLISNSLFALGQGLSVTVRAKMDAAAPSGIVGGIFLYAPPANSGNSLHDEIDFELLTTDPTRIHTNVYGHESLGIGHPTAYPFATGSITAYHDYQIKWLPDQVSWYVDGALVRTVTTQSPLPTGPMYVHLNMWVPASDFAAAYDPNLHWTNNPFLDQKFSLIVDSVTVQTVSK